MSLIFFRSNSKEGGSEDKSEKSMAVNLRKLVVCLNLRELVVCLRENTRQTCGVIVANLNLNVMALTELDGEYGVWCVGYQCTTSGLILQNISA